MVEITRIGMDTSKSVFQLHGVNAAEEVVLRKKLRRQDLLRFFAKLPPCRVGMEACGGSHYWARELQALGHQVELIPPQYVKPYVPRGKTDAADAEGICEAMSRPKVRQRLVPVKSAESQAALMLAGLRERLGFAGLVFSDDLGMAAAEGVGDIVARARASLAAGCDMVLACNDFEAIEALMASWKPAPNPDLARRAAAMEAKK